MRPNSGQEELVRSHLLVIGFLCICFVGTRPALGQERFPLRAEFPSVKIVTTEDLAARYDEIIIVDVRADYEYEVVHVSKAIHIPLARVDFLEVLAKVRPRDGKRPIAFYCNGYTCKKSFEAAIKAMANGFTNVFSYDAGIFDWVQTHPARGTLLGKTPVDPARLISEEKVRAHMLSYAEFARRAQAPGAWVIDIREPMQRAKVPSFPRLDNLYGEMLNKRISSPALQGKTVLFFDAVGRQVQWLQYRLEDAGLRDYYFLEGGALSIP